MTVHVDEIHTQVSAGRPGHQPGEHSQSERGGSAADPPGAKDDRWRRAEARVHQLRCRVAAEGFDD
ncbi:hypothetical protein EV649_5073 [Kribbella sp. VKM Ac-2569]|uniref:hypothetical protein n=1 Tax=Kribbella sp. VKM Ac-2569 TaxID=2512220 RepID=UPI00102C23BC|nr:hypothetical protein [Kribbella sp. VKM Ac-2569]RZT17526.1 hypothetical protein EV649_5073 [Kribbella sp. VKM Ac-2569]